MTAHTRTALPAARASLLAASLLVATVVVAGCGTTNCPAGVNDDSLFCHARTADAGVDVRADAPAADALDVAADTRGACRADGDCLPAERCDTASGRCVPRCRVDDDCPAGQRCDTASGRCVDGCRSNADCAAMAATPVCDPARHVCVRCAGNDDCPTGQVCRDSACVDGCTDASRCAAGRACCAMGCVDTQTSLEHCGACGNACVGAAGVAPTCVAGHCGLACPSGRADCDGMVATGCEVDTTADPAHCGRCDTACPTRANATATCAMGACGFTCLPGFADCNRDPADGCEVNLNTDARNCGSCGNVCAAGVTCNGMGMCGDCVVGRACSTGVACQTGALTCPASGPVCTRTGLVPAGTSCGMDMVCDSAGSCNRCVQNAPCAPTGMACRTGRTECSSGAPVCVPVGNVAAGTTCGMNLVCDGSGGCVPCTAGMMCTAPGTPCRTGAIACGTGAPVCNLTTNVAAGTSCGADMVCDGAGSCVRCPSGMACTVPGTPCRTGTLGCNTGAPVCNLTTNVAAGTSCGMNLVCDGAGSCVPCTAGMMCTVPTTPCRTGAIACGTGAPVCNLTTNLPPGTTCPGGVCNGAGTCVPCVMGASCPPPGLECYTGTTNCTSGGPVCNATGYAGYLTACSGGGHCDGAGHCCSSSWGINSRTTVSQIADSYYTFHSGWCTFSEMCILGNYTHSQSYVSSYCLTPGSTGSCTDGDALWHVTCSAVVDCQYDCGGTCQPTSC